MRAPGAVSPRTHFRRQDTTDLAARTSGPETCVYVLTPEAGVAHQQWHASLFGFVSSIADLAIPLLNLHY